MLPASLSSFPPNVVCLAHCPIVVEHKNVVLLILFIVDQWKNIDIPKLHKYRVIENLLNVRLTYDVIPLLFQLGENAK